MLITPTTHTQLSAQPSGTACKFHRRNSCYQETQTHTQRFLINNESKGTWHCRNVYICLTSISSQNKVLFPVTVTRMLCPTVTWQQWFLEPSIGWWQSSAKQTDTRLLTGSIITSTLTSSPAKKLHTPSTCTHVSRHNCAQSWRSINISLTFSPYDELRNDSLKHFTYFITSIFNTL